MSNAPIINQGTKEPCNHTTIDRASPKRSTAKARPKGPEEVEAYFREGKYDFDPHLEAGKFWDYWESVGWLRKGNRPVKDWRSTARTWAGNVKRYANEAPRFGAFHRAGSAAPAARKSATDWSDVTGW